MKFGSAKGRPVTPNHIGDLGQQSCGHPPMKKSCSWHSWRLRIWIARQDRIPFKSNGYIRAALRAHPVSFEEMTGVLLLLDRNRPF